MMLLVPPHCSNPDSGTSITVRPCKNLACAQRMLQQNYPSQYNTSQKWVLQNDPRHTGHVLKMREETKQQTTLHQDKEWMVSTSHITH